MRGGDDRWGWSFAERWPVVFVAPAFYLGGYTGGQVVAFTLVVILLAEMVFAVVKVLLLDRAGRR